MRTPYIEAYVLGEPEVVRIHAKVVHDEGVVHVVGEVCRNGEITETHHLLGGVDDDRVVDAGSVWLWILLQAARKREREKVIFTFSINTLCE